MSLSRHKLNKAAAASGFRAEILEKVVHLIGLLNGLAEHPYLKGKLALKGGTALNLFELDLPRLSVDIDLNMIGSVDRQALDAARSDIERAFHGVFQRMNMRVIRVPTEHAGGKWQLKYDSGTSSTGNLEVDLNYMYRLPLWEPVTRSSMEVAGQQCSAFPVLDLHELAAGKLVALFARHASRDLFDAHQLLTRSNLDRQKTRIAFVAYAAMNRSDLRDSSAQDILFTPAELHSQLLPTLNKAALDSVGEAGEWAGRLVREVQDSLGLVLPFTPEEKAFLDGVLERSEIQVELLTDDKDLQERLAVHPLLQWKTSNVRKHRGLS